MKDDVASTNTNISTMKIIYNEGVYTGEFDRKLKTRCNRGSMFWADNSVYEGTWLNDKPNGRGRFV